LFCYSHLKSYSICATKLNFDVLFYNSRVWAYLLSPTLFRLLRVWWFLIWHFIDKILAKQGLEDIIQISQFVGLAFSLRQKFAKTFLYAYTPWHISETRRNNAERKIYLLQGFIMKKPKFLYNLYNYYLKLYSGVFVDKCYISSRTCKKPPFFGHNASKNLSPLG
jgi:hypothetical protein